jgi:Ca2+-binding RTX toxin-like protein
MPAFVGTGIDDSVVGSLQDDTIQGGGGDDFLSGGGGGTDRLEGGLGNDTYISADYYGDTFIEAAGQGVDTMIWTTGDCWGLAENFEILRLASAQGETGIGNDGDNSIYGNDAGNWLYGRGGDDVIIAGQGDDRLDGEGGDNTLHGGEGADTYFVRGAGDAVVEFAGEGLDIVHVAEVGGAFASTPYVLAANVETLIWDSIPSGGLYTRTMSGNALDNLILDDAYGNSGVIKGLAGNDHIDGGWDNDRLEGGQGDDYLIGSYNLDTLNGGAGADLFVANAYMGSDVIEDFVIGEDRIALLDGMAVDRIVQEGADARVIFAETYEAGDSMLLKGLRAADLNLDRDFAVDAQPEALTQATRANVPGQTLTGDAGFNYLRGDWGADLITGLDGNDDLYGNVGKDTLLGGAGNDNLDGEEGADRMEGGAGNDLYLVRDATDSLVENTGEGLDEARVYINNYTLAANVERLDLSFGQAVTANGNGGDNRLNGNDLDNVLNGGDGNDELLGGTGADLLQGGDGADRLDGGLDGPGNSENGYKDIGDTLVGGAGADRFMVGFRYENGFEPNGADIVADFTDGEDLIEAWGVLGWQDIQSIVNEDGTEDTLVVFDNGEYYDATLLLKGVSRDQINADDFIFGYNGTSFADTLQGTANNDMLNAGGGADVLKSGGGSDEMIGGAGNDTYYADGNDDVVEDGGEGTDTVVAEGDYRLEDNVENLTLAEPSASAPAGALGAASAPSGPSVGRGNALDNRIEGNSQANSLKGLDGADRLSGDGGADRLYGGDGRDRLDGGAGRDLLVGGEGRDLLTGGGGADVFRFGALSHGGDTIRDFSLADGDVIDLSRIDANSGRDGDQAFRFVDAFTGRTGQAVLTYDQARDRTVLQLDADGDGASDFSLLIAGEVTADPQGWVL